MDLIAGVSPEIEDGEPEIKTDKQFIRVFAITSLNSVLTDSLLSELKLYQVGRSSQAKQNDAPLDSIGTCMLPPSAQALVDSDPRLQARRYHFTASENLMRTDAPVIFYKKTEVTWDKVGTSVLVRNDRWQPVEFEGHCFQFFHQDETDRESYANHWAARENTEAYFGDVMKELKTIHLYFRSTVNRPARE
mgnify:FL=1